MTEQNNFDGVIGFCKYRKQALIVSLALTVSSIFFLFGKGLNKGIDFTGGIIIEARTKTEFKLDNIRSLFADKELGEVTLQHFGSEQDLLLRINKDGLSEKKQADKINIVKDNLKQQYSDIEFRRVDFVGPTVGGELVRKSIIALAAAFIAILAYIWIRFDFEFGIGAIIALIHDIILTFGFFSIFQLEFNLTSIAALLITIGYSINDSVVIYDRVRENTRKYRKKELSLLIDKSLTDTLRRTLLTGCTTIVAIISLILFGGPVLFSFSLAVLFGVIVGTYSSLYIAAPVLLFFRKN